MSAVLENAVGGLLGNQAHGIITLVLSRIKQEIKLLRNYRKELEELQEHLTKLNELLHGSDEINNKLLSNWLEKVRNVAYAADDLLDYCSYEALKHGSRTRKRDKLKNITNPVDIYNIAHKTKKLKAQIDSIYMDGHKHGIKPIQVAAGYTYDSDAGTSRQSHENLEKRLQDRRQWVDDEGLIGRDQDLTQLFELLCNPSNNCRSLTVVGIVGMAGLGKTALSRRIAAAEEVMRHFNSNVFWLVVSHCYDLEYVLNQLLELVYKDHANISNSQAVVEKLGGKLKGNKYLLILDDVWDTIDWEPLTRALQRIGGSEGTTLLVTSRDKKVVANMDTYGPGIHKAMVHQLEGLNDEDSWSLFMQRAGGDSLVTREKQKIGSRILRKCGGIPLAIRAIGNLLRNKSVEEWREIEENEEWSKESDILPSLKLSFIYLPNIALKKCFSFCAIFRGGDLIQKEKLIQMWMGQGFLQPYDKMEHVGEEYVEILLNNSFFHEAKLDQFGNVIAFKMHDLVLYLARITSGEECFNLEEKQKHMNSLTTEVRHLSTSVVLQKKEIVSAKYCDRLRTYYNSCPQFQREIFGGLSLFLEHSSCLRLLCLQRLGLESLPKAIKKLKLLRYLDISQNCFAILPDVITKLYHLQTLRIDYNSNREVKCNLSREKVFNLVKLRHISGESVDIGILNGMGHLTALRTLSTINLKSNWGGKVNELASLTNLRGKLGISGLECMKWEEEARSLNLGRLLGVDKLVLEWSEKLSAEDGQNQILESLKPHKKLSTLDVAHYNGSRLPEWLTGMAFVKGSQQFSELISLTLRHCFYAKGHLNLKNFSSLRFLSLECCYELTISLPENGFHCCNLLESLMLSSCYNVGNLGDLSPLTRLQYLKVMNCAKTTYELVGLASLPCLEEVITDRLLPKDLGRGSAVCKSLRSLYLSTQTDAGNLPVQLQHLVALQKLHIYDFKGLEILPEWLGKFSSLSLLNLGSLPSLDRLPSENVMQSLSNLKGLFIQECPSLKRQFTARNGEWFKINHIPSIIADFQPLDKTKV